MSLALQIGGMLTRVAAVQAAALAFPLYISESYALSGVVAYGAYLAVVLHVVAARARDVAAQVSKAAPYVLVWVAGGVAVSAALRALFAGS
jgi:hypothetical protein